MSIASKRPSPRWTFPSGASRRDRFGRRRASRPKHRASRHRSQPAASQPASSRGSIMVPVERLEELVRLVGEAASAHLRVGRMLQDRFGVDPSRFTEFNDLSRLLNELQDRAMRTQMVPVATITDRLHRAVRDLARAQGKDVRWEVEGEHTELDRGVLHQLADSLLHLVRNAVDHGIESPERAPRRRQALHGDRAAARDAARFRGDHRGHRRRAGHRRRRRAGEGRAHGIDTDGLTDAETLQLVFRSGLSTAQFVTDVSGRGVGLDVVRANVEAAAAGSRSRPSRCRHRVPDHRADHARGAALPAGRGRRPALRAAVPSGRRRSGRRRRDVPCRGTRRSCGSTVRPVPVASLAETLGRPDEGGATGPIVVVRRRVAPARLPGRPRSSGSATWSSRG